MANHKLEFRHRPNYAEPIEEKHAQFLAQLSGLGAPWDLAGTPEVPDIASELVVSVPLDKQLPAGVKGRMTYALRNQQYLEDDAQFDDTLFIEFAGNKLDYSDLLDRVFPAYIQAFGAYRATLHDWSVTRNDWPVVLDTCEATGKDVNGREGVFRINAANYFDQELCTRAFAKTAQQIVECLNGHVHKVAEFEGGVLIIVSDSPLSSDELMRVGERLKDRLRSVIELSQFR